MANRAYLVIFGSSSVWDDRYRIKNRNAEKEIKKILSPLFCLNFVWQTKRSSRGKSLREEEEATLTDGGSKKDRLPNSIWAHCTDSRHNLLLGGERGENGIVEMARLSFPHAKTHSWKKRRRRRGFLQLMKEKSLAFFLFLRCTVGCQCGASFSILLFSKLAFLSQAWCFWWERKWSGMLAGHCSTVYFLRSDNSWTLPELFLLARIWNFLSPFLREAVCGVGSQITWLSAWLQEARKKHPNNNPEK